jgi:hypothetical protein
VFADVVAHGHGLDFPAVFRRRRVCLGYRVEAEDKVVAFSGDSAACRGPIASRGMPTCWSSAATWPGPSSPRRPSFAWPRTPSPARTRWGRIARQARVKKLVLTHFRPTSEPVFQSIAGDVARDYDGPVVLGRDLMEMLV